MIVVGLGDLGGEREHVGGAKRRLVTTHLVEKTPERPYVGFLVVRLVLDYLRTRVEHRAHDRVHLGAVVLF